MAMAYGREQKNAPQGTSGWKKGLTRGFYVGAAVVGAGLVTWNLLEHYNKGTVPGWLQHNFDDAVDCVRGYHVEAVARNASHLIVSAAQNASYYIATPVAHCAEMANGIVQTGVALATTAVVAGVGALIGKCCTSGTCAKCCEPKKEALTPSERTAKRARRGKGGAGEALLGSVQQGDDYNSTANSGGRPTPKISLQSAIAVAHPSSDEGDEENQYQTEDFMKAVEAAQLKDGEQLEDEHSLAAGSDVEMQHGGSGGPKSAAQTGHGMHKPASGRTSLDHLQATQAAAAAQGQGREQSVALVH